MKKVIVFVVENVLLKSNDEKKMEERNVRKFLKMLMGEDMFEELFGGGDNNGDGVGDYGMMYERVRMLEEKYESEGDMRRFKMKEVRKGMEDWKVNMEARREEKRRKYMDGEYVKRVIRMNGELMDLERICDVTGSEMVFVSGERKGKVKKMLENNGLKRFVIESDLGFLEGMDEKGYVVFDDVRSLEKMWECVGLRKC